MCHSASSQAVLGPCNNLLNVPGTNEVRKDPFLTHFKPFLWSSSRKETQRAASSMYQSNSSRRLPVSQAQRLLSTEDFLWGQPVGRGLWRSGKALRGGGARGGGKVGLGGHGVVGCSWFRCGFFHRVSIWGGGVSASVLWLVPGPELGPKSYLILLGGLLILGPSQPAAVLLRLLLWCKTCGRCFTSAELDGARDHTGAPWGKA